MIHGSSALVISWLKQIVYLMLLKPGMSMSLVTSRLGSIPKCLDRSSNHFLLNLEADLIKKYVNVRDQEAVFWHQNSRDGDKIKTLIST